MANETTMYAGAVTAVLAHPTLGNISLQDNMSKDGVRVSISRQFTRTTSYNTGAVARAIHRKGASLVQVMIDSLVLSANMKALLMVGCDVADTEDEDDSNALAENLGDLTIHPVENGASTVGDLIIYNVVNVSEKIDWVFSADAEVFFKTPLVLEGTLPNATDPVFTLGKSSDVTAQSVSAVSPVDGAVGQAVDVAVQVTFSDDVMPGDVTLSNFTLIRGDTAVEIGSLTVSYDAGLKKVTIGHAAFPAATKIIGFVSKDVRDESGNAMAANYYWDFTTA